MFCRRVFSYPTAKLNHIRQEYEDLLEAYMKHISTQPVERQSQSSFWPINNVEVDLYDDQDIDYDDDNAEEAIELPTTTTFLDAGIPIVEDPEELRRIRREDLVNE